MPSGTGFVFGAKAASSGACGGRGGRDPPGPSAKDRTRLREALPMWGRKVHSRSSSRAARTRGAGHSATLVEHSPPGYLRRRPVSSTDDLANRRKRLTPGEVAHAPRPRLVPFPLAGARA